MHNIGRTVRETYESNYETDPEFNTGFQQEFEYVGSGYAQETSDEMETGGWMNEQETWNNEVYETGESPFNEIMELELASELLEVQTEEELDQFLGKLIRKAGPSGIRNFVQSKGGRMLGGVLKKVAKVALPMAGRVVGGMFGGPIGAKIGGNIGQFATRAFGLELEGLSAEDQEFAMSKAFVRFAGAAARNTQTNNKTRVQPRNAVRESVIKAAKQFAPGLLNPMPGAYRSNYDKGIYDHRHYETGGGQWTAQEQSLPMQEF